MDVPQNRNGGLSLVAMPGFEAQAALVAKKILSYSEGRAKSRTPVDVVIPEFGTRANGEPFLRLGKRHIGGHDCVILASGPGTLEMLGQLNLLLRYVAARRATRVALVTGYFPLCRSDKDEGELELALSEYVISQMVAATKTTNCHLDRIIAVDLHAPQMVMAGPTGLITELTLIRLVLRRAVEDALAAGETVCLAFPDDGSAKRTERAIDALEKDIGIHLPIVCGIKRRASSTESELRQLFGSTGSLPGATVLSVDDEIATGGTNIAFAKLVKSQYGASRVHAVVTHAVLCGNAADRFGAADSAVDRLYVTDTIPLIQREHLQPLIRSGRLVTVPWSSELGVSLYHHHWDLSIRPVR